MKKSQKNTTCIISLGLDFTFEATTGPRLELVMRQQGQGYRLYSPVADLPYRFKQRF